MIIILYTNQQFLIKEIKKIKTISNLKIIENNSDLFSIIKNNESFIFLHHLDMDIDIFQTINIIQENFTNFKLISLRNSTNSIEGCSLLKLGYNAYAHSMSNSKILEDVITTVKSGNTWIYPELMQFLIQSIPINDIQKDKLLNKVTTKELEVLELVAQGLNNNKIANTLNIAEITVKKYISTLFKKLQLKDRLSLALYFNNYTR